VRKPGGYSFEALRWVRSTMAMSMLTVFSAILLALMAVGWLADMRAHRGSRGVTPGLSLLPGDFKYESADGRVKVYFPVVTSIVLSVVLTLVLKYMT
jgi:hypothetical protein